MRGARIVLLAELEDSPTAAGLNAIRWLAHPGPRRPAHLTVCGPVPVADAAWVAKAFANAARRLDGQRLRLTGVGTFGGRRPRTVFLDCDCPALTEVAWRPEGTYTPHLSLYNGRDRDFAAELARLCRARFRPATLVLARPRPVVVGRVGNPLDSASLRAPAALGWFGPAATYTLNARTSASARLDAIAGILDAIGQ